MKQHVSLLSAFKARFDMQRLANPRPWGARAMSTPGSRLEAGAGFGVSLDYHLANCSWAMTLQIIFRSWRDMPKAIAHYQAS